MLRPIVLTRRGKRREGRGFSREEIKAAGLNVRRARKLGIAVDERRKTCSQENVTLLKEFLKTKT